MSTTTSTHQPCPSCGSSDALSTYTDGHSYCFSCNQYFPSPAEGSGLGRAGDNIDRPNDTNSFQSMPEWRGIRRDTFQFYGVKACVRGSDGAILDVRFPYPGGGSKVRLFGDKAFYTTGDIKPGCFGRDRFAAGSHRDIVLTEGELDALAVYQVLRCPAISVRSASSGFNDARSDLSFISAFDRIYLAFDSDEPGQGLVRTVAKLFDYNKVYHVKLAPLKDANDYVIAGKSNELATVFAHAKRYLPETIVSSFSDFESILNSSPSEGVPYPFQTLNEMTFGMRKGESVLVTAQEGVGKTEFMHAIEYQLLQQTRDPVGAIFLEEPKKRHLQAIAGLHVRCPVHLPDQHWNNTEINRALQEAIGMDERLLVYSHFGSDDPDSLLDTIRFMVSGAGVCWVCLDHITMAVSGVSGLEDERRKLDYLSTRLEMMVKELDFGLIIVSHVNDFGQTRGSRYISKIADIRIDLTRDLNHPHELVRNTTVLNVSKNRFSGRTGPAGKLFFDNKTFTFNEIREADHEDAAPMGT